MCRDIRSSICDGEGSKTIAVSLIRSPCPDRTVCAISGVAIHHNSYVERRPGPGLPSSKVQACLLSVKGRRYSARVSARSWLSAMATELQTGTRVSAQVLDTQEAREETAWAPLHACWLAAASKLLANDDLLLDYTSLQSLQSLQLRKSARCSSSFQVHDVCRMNRRTDGAVPPAVFLAYLKKDSATHNTLQTSRTIDSDRGVTVSRSVLKQQWEQLHPLRATSWAGAGRNGRRGRIRFDANLRLAGYRHARLFRSEPLVRSDVVQRQPPENVHDDHEQPRLARAAKCAGHGVRWRPPRHSLPGNKVTTAQAA